VPTNYKTEKLITLPTGYNYRTTQGGGLTDAEYFNPDGSTNKYR
jgi:hypothetical protein